MILKASIASEYNSSLSVTTSPCINKIENDLDDIDKRSEKRDKFLEKEIELTNRKYNFYKNRTDKFIKAFIIIEIIDIIINGINIIF